MENIYKSRKDACKLLNITYPTLYKLANNKEIETIKVGKIQKYNVNKYMLKIKAENPNKKNICYCRVSSAKQKEDLKRQQEYMKEKYPNYEILSDIGSGLNFNRANLKKIIDMFVKGELNELVIAYKDRLARFGYELIENMIKDYSNGKITVLNKSEEQTPTEELTKDIVSIMNVYVAKINGLRKYKTQLTSEIKKDIKI
jgi:excisionase family DNA binding protein